jgi:type IV pilus assembly protein PilW
MTEEMSRLQENARFAMDQLTFDLRMSGYQGCADPATATANIVVTGAVYTNSMTGGANNSGTNSSDTLTLQFANGNGVALLSDMANRSSDVIARLDQTANIAVDDLVAIADCESVDVFKVTSKTDNTTATPQSSTFAHGTSTNDSANLTKAYTTDARLISFSDISYAIANTGTNLRGKPIFSLQKNGTTIAEGVENLQVQFGERQGATSTANVRYFAANAVSNWNRVVSVRIGMLLATREAARDAIDTTTYSVLGVNMAPGVATAAATYDATDRRVRRVFTSTIKIRNRR